MRTRSSPTHTGGAWQGIAIWHLICLPLTHTSYLLRGIGSGADVSLWSVGILLIYLVVVFAIGGQAFIKLKN